MSTPDGKNYQNRSEFHSINENQGLQIRHLSAPHYKAEIRLIPKPSGTRVAFYQCFESAEMCQKISAFVGPANHENLARLAALLGEAEWP